MLVDIFHDGDMHFGFAVVNLTKFHLKMFGITNGLDSKIPGSLIHVKNCTTGTITSLSH